MEYLRVRNFEKFQHYKNRTPPWIKLYRDFWQNPEVFQLKTSQKLYVIGFFTLASESENKIPYDKKWIQSRLGIKQDVDIQELIDLRILEPASNVLASHKESCYQNAIVEKEKEKEKEKEPLTPKGELCEIGKRCNGKFNECHRQFEIFWNKYPRHDPPKKITMKCWCTVFSESPKIEEITEWIEEAKERWTDQKFIPQPTTFLNQRRWTGDLPPKNEELKPRVDYKKFNPDDF